MIKTIVTTLATAALSLSLAAPALADATNPGPGTPTSHAVIQTRDVPLATSACLHQKRHQLASLRWTHWRTVSVRFGTCARHG